MSVIITSKIVKGFTGQQPILDAKQEDVANVTFLPDASDFDAKTGILTLKGITASGAEVTRRFQLIGSEDELWVGWTRVKAQADNDSAISIADAKAVENAIVATMPQDLDNLSVGCRIIAESPSPAGWYKPVFICEKERAGIDAQGNHSLEFFNNLNATDTDSWVLATQTLVVNAKEYAVFVKNLPVSEETSIKYLVKRFK